MTRLADRSPDSSPGGSTPGNLRNPVALMVDRVAEWRRARTELGTLEKREVSGEALIFLAAFVGLFGVIARPMGLANMLNTMMNTAFELLTGTVFYIMAIAVLAGAISALFAEFGVVALLNVLLARLMRPVYGLPGASALGMVTCFLSDNPAVLTLSHDRAFRRYFRQYQLPALTNLGTAFGMGLIVSTFMLGLKGADGQGFGLVMLLTKGPGEGGAYTGAAFEGIGLLPLLGQKLAFLLDPLFGLVPSLLHHGQAGGNDIAVFTAMCMCWSGFLSTHVAMMHSLGCSHLIGKAIFSHTLGGLAAGVTAHWLYVLLG